MLMLFWFKIVKMDPRENDYQQGFSNRVILMNTFFGLDEARSLPPNVFMTGTMLKPQKDLMV